MKQHDIPTIFPQKIIVLFKSFRFVVVSAAQAGRDIALLRRISGPEPEAVQEIRGKDES